MFEKKRESIDDLDKGWSKGTFHPVYLFAGPDTLAKEEAVVRLRSRFLKGEEGGMNEDRFDGDVSSAADIVNAYQTLPFLGPGRFVLVRRAQDLSPAEMNRLAEAVETPAKGNCLVLLWDEKVDGRNALVRAARSAGKEVMFWIPFENQLPRWIVDRARAAGKAMSLEAARTLLEMVGPSPSDLAQELEKLVLYVKDRADIRDEDVEKSGGGNRTLQFMEWDRALWSGDRTKVLELSSVLRAQGQAPEALLSQTARAFQKLLMGKALKAEKVSPADMWERLWIKSRDTQQAFEAALDRRGWEEVMDILESLAQADQDLKTGRLDPEAGITLLLRRLT